jgi:Zn-dependent metalloprotease
MKRFSAKFTRTLVLGMAAAGALGACGAEDAPVIPGVEEVGVTQAEQALASHLDKVGTARAEFVRSAAFRDELGIEHTRFQQTVGGVPVFGGEAIVHRSPTGEELITDDFRQGLSVANTVRLNDAEAIARAVSLHGGFDKLTAEPESALVALPREDGTARLTYKVELKQEQGTDATTMPVLFIDAQTGEKVWGYDNLQTASATGTGNTLYSGAQSITTLPYGGTYYLENTVNKLGAFDFRNTTSSVYRVSSTSNVFGNGSSSNSQSAAADAFYGAQKTYDYYKNVHARNGINGSGGPGGYNAADSSGTLISSRVHYSTNYNNAYWSSPYMTYGDGDGVKFRSLVTLDIAGHEMTHGVTQNSAGLIYSNESGALNESMSDVFGAMVERYTRGETTNTWLIGEEAYTPGTAGDALRYMANPHAKVGGTNTVDDDPCHYAERYTGTNDNGGVHINSGIGNHAFYLLAKGGTNHRSGLSVTAIGADAAAKIWYKALTGYMTSSTNFAGARTATLNAAAALYGSGTTNYNAVAQAWSAVGVN